MYRNQAIAFFNRSCYMRFIFLVTLATFACVRKSCLKKYLCDRASDNKMHAFANIVSSVIRLHVYHVKVTRACI